MNRDKAKESKEEIELKGALNLMVNKKSKRYTYSNKQKHHPLFPKHLVFNFVMPVFKMYISCQFLQKQNFITVQTISSTIPSDSPECPKVQTPVLVAESKTTEEKTVRKVNSKTKQTDSEGKVSYNPFDSNIELIDAF